MRIIIVSSNFPPEPVVSSITSTQLAYFLAAKGHSVLVVTGFPSRPKGKLYSGYKRRIFQYESTLEGFRIIRCFGFLSSKSTVWSRFLENISLGVTCGWIVLTARRPDAIFAKTWPIFASGILAVIAKVRGIKLILNIQDLYPESLFAQKRISQNGVISRGLMAIDRWNAKVSSAVVVPTPSFAAVYRQSRRVPSEKLHFVPNWINCKSIVADDVRGAAFREKLRIPINAKMVLYGGNVGAAAGVETVIESFRYLKKIENLYLTIAGDGTNIRACQNMALGMDHPRIRFYTPWPAAETSQALSAADILILPTRGQQSLASIPSKLISYMLSARPVLAMSLSESDLARVVHKSGCGWVVDPDQPELLAEMLEKILCQPEAALRSRGLAGRLYALSNFTGDACLPKFAEIIKDAISE
jgi:colanic acid biosynthesis glycosyl transferase WcaI